MKSVLSVAAFIAAASVALGQARKTDNTITLGEGDKPGTGTLADCAWFAGYWVGPGLEGNAKNFGSHPLAGSREMLGTFRFVKDGKTAFTEHIMLVPDGNSLTMKLKHFDAMMKGWEPQDQCKEFKLVKVEKDAVYFSGLTMKKTSDGMDVFVAITNRKDGTVREEKFAYKAGKLGK